MSLYFGDHWIMSFVEFTGLWDWNVKRSENFNVAREKSTVAYYKMPHITADVMGNETCLY